MSKYEQSRKNFTEKHSMVTDQNETNLNNLPEQIWQWKWKCKSESVK